MDIEAEMRELWAKSFGDGPEYIDFFMKNRPPSAEPVLERRGGRAAGGAWGLPCHILGLGPAVYGYAVAALPEARGRGVASGLLRAWGERLRESGAALCVLAADDALCDFYEKLGFTRLPSRKRVVLEAQGGAKAPAASEAEDGEYLALRDAFFSWDGCVRWELPFVRYALKEARFSGGFAHKLTFSGRGYLLRGEKRGERLLVRETTMDDETLARSAGALGSLYGVSELECLLPARSGLPGETERRAFVYGDAPANIGSLWIGLTLD